MLMHQPLLENAARRPDAPAFRWVDRDRTLSYAQAVTQMNRMAGALHHLGARKGDRVAVFAHNGLDYLIAMFGAWRIGAIAALVIVAIGLLPVALLSRAGTTRRTGARAAAAPPI